MEFLDFELPVKEILEQIDKCKSIENEIDVDVTKTFNLLQKNLLKLKRVYTATFLHGKKFNYLDIQTDRTLLTILIIYVVTPS